MHTDMMEHQLHYIMDKHISYHQPWWFDSLILSSDYWIMRAASASSSHGPQKFQVLSHQHLCLFLCLESLHRGILPMVECSIVVSEWNKLGLRSINSSQSGILGLEVLPSPMVSVSGYFSKIP